MQASQLTTPRSNKSMAIFLGIDIGTSSIKGALMDTEHNSLSNFRQRPFPNRISGLPESHYEVSPTEIVETTDLLISELLEGCQQCAGILFSSQMGGVLLAGSDGRMLCNYISWRDQRSLAMAPSNRGSPFETLEQKTTREDFEALGNEVQPGSAVSIITALAETGRLDTGELLAMNLGDYVVAALCKAEPHTERTMAVGILNLHTGTIHRDWFDRLTDRKIVWPNLVQVDQPVGHMRTALGDIPCYPAVGDHQGALLGAGVQPGELSINVSTGSQVGTITTSLELSEDYQTRPFFAGQYVNTITHLPAGRALNALVDLLTELPRLDGYVSSDPWKEIIRSIDEADDSQLKAEISYFDCKVGTHGSLQGMRLENMTIGHLFRAALDNMVDNYVAAAEKLSPERAWNGIVLSGGLAQKMPYLREKIQKALDAPLRMATQQEETLCGLLALARQISR